MVRALFLFVIFFSCKDHFYKPIAPKIDLNPILEKMAVYISLQSRLMDAYGWLHPRCDALLFNSLSVVAGSNINIGMAEESPGKWQRHPGFDCFMNGANSEISRDMIRGLMIYMIETGDLNGLQRLHEYGRLNGWIMGASDTLENRYGKTLLTPQMVWQLEEAIHKLSGLPLLLRAGEAFFGAEGDFSFEHHLTALNIYTDFLIYEKINQYQFDFLKSYADSQPENAVYQALYHLFSDGDQTKAFEILMNENYFPNDRLPTAAERCTDYLFQRNMEGSDWKPCLGSDTIHPGIDFLFAAHILTGS